MSSISQKQKCDKLFELAESVVDLNDMTIFQLRELVEKFLDLAYTEEH